MGLFRFQKEALYRTKQFNNVAYCLEMGLGKTFVGAEKMSQLDAKNNLLICQCSKIDDWLEHFNLYYKDKYEIYNLTKRKEYEQFINTLNSKQKVGVINYELVFRREEIKDIDNLTLMLDESSLIQNETAKRTKFIKEIKRDNCILLTGTLCNGKYERLITQVNMLGWNISKWHFWNRYVKYEKVAKWSTKGSKRIKSWYPNVLGYKNVEDLKCNLKKYGFYFLKLKDVPDLIEEMPKMNDVWANCKTTNDYKKFKACTGIRGRVQIGDEFFNTYTHESKIDICAERMNERLLCTCAYVKDKENAIKEILESTDDRVIIMYSFNKELYKLEEICKQLGKPISYVNGHLTDKEAYEKYDNSVTLMQYQVGAMGHNMQKANKMIFASPPDILETDTYEQAKKRIHRIGQERPCFYYHIVSGNIEYKIYEKIKEGIENNAELIEKKFMDN